MYLHGVEWISIMDVPKFRIRQGRLDCNDFSDVFQIDAVLYNPHVIDIFTECRSFYNIFSSETDFVDHKNATDSYKEQNEEKLAERNPNLENLGHSKFVEDSSASECITLRIKNWEGIDILYEDNNSNEEKSSKCFTFCKVCYQNFAMGTDNFKCSSCQKQNESLFYNLLGEDMTRDVKQTSLGLTTDSELNPLKVEDDALSADEVTKELDSTTVSQWNSERLMANDNEMKREFCSKPLGNNFTVESQMNVMTEGKNNCKICTKSSRKDYSKVHEKSHTDEKPFCCKILSKYFSLIGILKTHEKSHIGEKLFHCKLCSKAFTNSMDLGIHKRILTEEKPFHCKILSESFRLMGIFKIHEKSHIGEKPFHCRIICYSMDLGIHKRIPTGEKLFHCKILSKSFSLIDILKIHEKSHIGEKPFRCKIICYKPVHCKLCSKAFTISMELGIHKRILTEEKPFHCKILSKSGLCTLKIHEKSHIGEKPFQCKIICYKPSHCKLCSKAFLNSMELGIHKKIPTGEKLFHWNILSNSFSLIGILIIHEKSHIGEKPFHYKIICYKPAHFKLCSKAFANSMDLGIHKRIITGEKPFHCKILSKSFSLMCILKIHEKSHIGEKPFHCKICYKSFRLVDDLKRHESHTGEKSFHCKTCLKSFIQNSASIIHERSHTVFTSVTSFMNFQSINSTERF